MSGVDTSGFTSKSFDEIVSDLEDEAKIQFGADVDLTDTSPLKQFINSIATEFFNSWSELENTYYSGYIDHATGQSLDNVVAILGITRNPAVKAAGQVTFSGTDTTVIPAGTVVQTTGDNPVKFTTDAEVTITGGVATSDITAQDAGANGNVAADTITALEIAISGVSSLTNSSPTTGGSDTETDPALRLRGKEALEGKGLATVNAIKQNVLAVPGVTGVATTEDLINHTLELTVSGNPTPGDVDQAIEDSRPAGIEVTWTTPTQVTIYVDATVTHDSSNATVLTDVQTAIVDYVNNIGVGNDVIYNELVAVSMEVDGVTDMDLTSGESDDPTGTVNIVIDSTEVAITSSSEVDVV